MGIFQVKDNQPEALLRLERWFARHPQNAPDFRGVGKKRVLSLLRKVALAVLENHLPPRLARVSRPQARQTLGDRPRLAARLITASLA